MKTINATQLEAAIINAGVDFVPVQDGIFCTELDYCCRLNILAS